MSLVVSASNAFVVQPLSNYLFPKSKASLSQTLNLSNLEVSPFRTPAMTG